MGKTASATGLAEGNLAIGQGKQRMILAHADILTGVEFGAALTDNDIAGNYAFPAKFFHAKAASCGISAVTGTTTCFFMSHIASPKP
jgi:hypothetical protein